MKEIKKRLELDRLSYYETHLSFINCILPIKMTPMEIKVLAGFMSLEGDIAIYRFGTSGRRIIMNQLKISPAGLTNFTKSLRDKGFIEGYSDETVILPILVPEIDQQDYRFRLINTNYHEQTT